jgi:hypothetical protein
MAAPQCCRRTCCRSSHCCRRRRHTCCRRTAAVVALAAVTLAVVALLLSLHWLHTANTARLPCSQDLQERLGKIVVAYRDAGKASERTAITARDIKVNE